MNKLEKLKISIEVMKSTMLKLNPMTEIVRKNNASIIRMLDLFLKIIGDPLIVEISIDSDKKKEAE